MNFNNNTNRIFNYIYLPYYKNSYHYVQLEKLHNTLFPSSSFVIEIASPVPDETSVQAAEGPARNGGHPAEPVLLLTMYIKLILILKYNVNIN